MTDTKKNLIRITASAALFAVAFGLYIAVRGIMPVWAWLCVFLCIYLVIGYDVLWRSVRNITRGRVFDENFLMVVATVGAFALSEFEEAVAVMLFYQVGEFFQSYAVGRSRKSIAALVDICPRTARLVTPSGEQTVYPEDVEIGSLIAVRAGERVPIDGVIEEGSGYIDCSALTGESAPVPVGAGDPVLSGAISQNAVLHIRTQKRYEDSAASRILELVENASAKKAKTENFITRFAAVYTPAVVGAAALLAVIPPLFLGYNISAVWAAWITRALTFLVVSCPCALVISVPMSFFGGIGAASKAGVLVKGGNYLELLNRVDVFVMDKTGTVTKGAFEVAEIVPAPGYDRGEVLYYAAVAENCSTHPVARSVVAAYGGELPSVNATELAGRGVTAIFDGEILCGNLELMTENNIAIPCAATGEHIGTMVYVAYKGEYLGFITVADTVKEDSAAAIAELKASGARTVILTGDSRTVAEDIAARVGADEVYSELLPAGKVEILEKLINGADGKKRGAVAFVGDGINDAPVLARADVGLAMGALGSDAAIEAADVILMNDKLSQISAAKRIAKRTTSIVLQNIIFALSVKVIVLILAALGLAGMWLAVFADVGVAALAILNAMRAGRVSETPRAARIGKAAEPA